MNNMAILLRWIWSTIRLIIQSLAVLAQHFMDLHVFSYNFLCVVILLGNWRQISDVEGIITVGWIKFLILSARSRRRLRAWIVLLRRGRIDTKMLPKKIGWLRWRNNSQTLSELHRFLPWGIPQLLFLVVFLSRWIALFLPSDAVFPFYPLFNIFGLLFHLNFEKLSNLLPYFKLLLHVFPVHRLCFHHSHWTNYLIILSPRL